MKKITSAVLLLLFFFVAKGQQKDANFNIILTDMDSIAEAHAPIHIYTDDKKFSYKGETDDLGFLKVRLPLGKNLHFDVFRFDTVFNLAQNIPVGNYGENEISVNIRIQMITNELNKWVLPVHFNVDGFVLEEIDKKAIDDLLTKIKLPIKEQIQVSAYTDSDGSDNYNMQLSQKRANSIRNYLIEKGISESKIVSKGFGETKPIASNATAEGKAKNRRVEVTLVESE